MRETSDLRLILFVPSLYDPHDQDQDLLLNLEQALVKHSYHL